MSSADSGLLLKLPQARREWLVVTVLVAVLGTLWIGMTRVEAEDVNPTGRPPSPDVGHPAPDFTLAALDGSNVTLSDLRGKPVLLNFWATWCGPCRAEIPALEAVWQSIGEEAVVLGVNVQEDPEIVAAFAQELRMTYPVALDTGARVARSYRVRAFPTTYFIDPRGVIVENYTGALIEPLIVKRIREIAAASP